MRSSRKLKIAVWHNLPSGGGKRALYHHVKGLLDRGHRLEGWTLSTADQSYLPLSDLLTEHVIPFDRNHPLRRLASQLSDYYDGISRMQAFDEACQRCATEIEAGGFDLLFANSSLLYFMPYIMRHVRIPKVLYLQEPYRPLYEANPILPWVNSPGKDLHHLYPFRSGALVFENLHLRALRVQARLEWLNARACDVILVNSYYSRESILRAYGCEARVCYLGVDTTRFRNLHKKREYFILGLGAFAKNKGVELSIKSISQLPEPRPRLIWIANSVDHSYLEEMRTAATAANVELQIQSSVTDEVLVDLLNRASLLLYTPRLEPFGLAPLEANACATPVIAVAEGGIRETIQDGVNGFLVDREPDAIAKALQKLLSDATLAREMGERAAAYVQEKWNIGLSIDRLEDNLFRVMSECN